MSLVVILKSAPVYVCCSKKQPLHDHARVTAIRCTTSPPIPSYTHTPNNTRDYPPAARTPTQTKTIRS